MHMIEVRSLTKSFGQLDVLKGVSFTLEKGGTTAVIGPSGSGKSTMLRCLIELERADGGDIIIEGETLCTNGVYPPEKEIRRVCGAMGMVFQHFNLFPHMTVRGNMLCAPTTLKRDDRVALEAKCLDALRSVGLEDKLNEYPGNLSGGQKQRVAIARALMMEPDILLFDEPTSALDPELTGEVLAVIQKLAAAKMTMIIVTHEIGFARDAADEVIFMDDGLIVERGTPAEVIENPQQARTQAFLQKVYA